jgi:hypothetical protein
MAMFDDEAFPLIGENDPAKELRFKLAWLNRRVENLEAIIFELLRDRVHHDLLKSYMDSLSNPGFGPHSAYIKRRGEQIAGDIDRWPKESLGWPAPRPKPEHKDTE